MIQIKNLKKSYSFGNQKLEILKGINIDLPQGKLITLMGPSGSGKSTFMHILSGIDRPDSGNVFINGEDISSFSEKDITQFRRKKIGIIFQFFNLMPYLSSVENVCLPLYLAGIGKKEAYPKAEKALSLVGLKNRFTHKPYELSGGEQQRVAIARSIVNSPEILFADEPTGNLDTENSDHIMELLIQLQKDHGFTIVMVTHNVEIGNRGDIKLSMKDGILV
ncbi:MAG TPA: ABC transporter ATP-binding protein [Leptospiraceae bacterium]|nr:ABC transporter ATP-binding protein [Leptospiraceae bacterium]HMW07556.1 ABC transporter ATP-binding protein [Leptospiraceae bacterium]HMX35093.1 ABC transporter ATP-binding protein [Leptospiraceae bacterium]HMY33143.1 ABC transporter ATP-binding protein [Leptospiraceae bacterium]HMZ66025.1 ABC transporter ATP-binding protein [Leptospiraceae bacterium]